MPTQKATAKRQSTGSSGYPEADSNPSGVSSHASKHGKRRHLRVPHQRMPPAHSKNDHSLETSVDAAPNRSKRQSRKASPSERVRPMSRCGTDNHDAGRRHSRPLNPADEETSSQRPSASRLMRSRPKTDRLALKVRQIKRIEKAKRRGERKRLEIELGPDAPAKNVPRTLENMRIPDETYVLGPDKEVEEDEAMDELSHHYSGKTTPKIFITTSLKSTKLCRDFICHLTLLFPNSHAYPRKNYSVKTLVDFAIRNDFTDLIVINEDHKQLNGMIHCHLPGGPTAIYRLSSMRMMQKINKVKLYSPELILSNFNTRLGRTVGRMLGALVPLNPEFEGRRVITMHNQRDYIFVRHHIYDFASLTAANLRELGPEFTLKLKSLQRGLFDKKHGEYLFQHKRENQPYSRKKFIL